MNIKEKIKSVWKKGRERFGKKPQAENDDGACGGACDIDVGRRDAELGADEVLREEVFPEKNKMCGKSSRCSGAKTANAKSANTGAKSAGAANKKNPANRTRPTNGNYRMIDPSNDTCDAGKS